MVYGWLKLWYNSSILNWIEILILKLAIVGLKTYLREITMFKSENQKMQRNFKQEAKELVDTLRGNQFYQLYEYVLKKLTYTNTVDRDKELNAVKREIESVKGLDEFRLAHITTGYKSEMATTARPQDGFTKPARRKV